MWPHLGSEIGRDLLGGRRGIGPGLVDQLKHVLFLVGRSPPRQQLTAFQVLESERSAELEPSHEDLRVYRFPAGPIHEPAAMRAIAFNPEEIVLMVVATLGKIPSVGIVAFTRTSGVRASHVPEEPADSRRIERTVP